MASPQEIQTPTNSVPHGLKEKMNSSSSPACYLQKLPNETLRQIVEYNRDDISTVRALGLCSHHLMSITGLTLYRHGNFQVYQQAVARADVEALKRCAAYTCVPADLKAPATSPDSATLERNMVSVLIEEYQKEAVSSDKAIQALQWLLAQGVDAKLPMRHQSSGHMSYPTHLLMFGKRNQEISNSRAIGIAEMVRLLYSHGCPVYEFVEEHSAQMYPMEWALLPDSPPAALRFVLETSTPPTLANEFVFYPYRYFFPVKSERSKTRNDWVFEKHDMLQEYGRNNQLYAEIVQEKCDMMMKAWKSARDEALEMQITMDGFDSL